MGLSLEAARQAYASGDEEIRRSAVERLSFAGEPRELLQFFVEAMGDASWRIRKEATARLTTWPDRTLAAFALVAALAESENVGRRNAAVEGLVMMGEAALEPLIQGLEGRPEHRKLLIDALGLIGHRRGARALIPFAEDADANVQMAAAEALGRIGGAEAEAVLKRLVGAADPILSLAALDGLNRMAVVLAPEQLQPLYEQPTLRAAVLEALGRSGEPRVLPQLVQGLSDSARSVRESAIVAIAELYRRADAASSLEVDPTVLPALVQALLEGTLGIQRAAARVLGMSRRPEAVRPLTIALGDPEVRESALQALATIGAPATEALVALAPDLESSLRVEIYALLPRLRPSASDPRVQNLLIEALSDEDVEAAAAAAQALGEVGSLEALGPLLRALEGERTLAQAAAAALGDLGATHYEQLRILISSRDLNGPAAPYLFRVVGLCGRAEDAAFLRAALGADTASIRRASAEALAQMPPSVEIDQALLFALADESAEVRAAAARTLGIHGALYATSHLERAAHDGEPMVRVTAARALGTLVLAAGRDERTQVVEALRRLAEEVDEVVAVPAIEALGALDDPADEDRLVASLQSNNVEKVKAAAYALGRRTPLRLGPILRGLEQALSDSRWDVRQAAVVALGQFGEAARGPLFTRHQVERDPLVLETIERILQTRIETEGTGGLVRPSTPRQDT